RLSTFSNWPSNRVHPVSLAEAGFIYLGTGDTVQCVYCQGKLSQWENGDDPIREHFRHFSTCFYILEMKMNNSALLTGTSNAVEVTDSCTDRPHVNTNSSSDAHASNNPTTNNKYITMSSRFETLKNWAHLTLTANQLSLAGFYWDEEKKSCKCFRCNVIITNWQVDDDPFKVHALKSPECSYISQVKGKQFVADTVKTFVNALKDENEKLRDEKMCIICTIEPKTILILPCAHLVCCSKCASSLQSCPVCRTKIMGTVKTFL
ncbi:hypothetical protein LOTGIDRAFT_94905, partial [Lottia gigantea]